MADSIKSYNGARYNNISTSINSPLPVPLEYSNATAANEYNAATVSSIVFGIFMALLTLYMIYQNGIQCSSE
jgi:hypothetical protein